MAPRRGKDGGGAALKIGAAPAALGCISMPDSHYVRLITLSLLVLGASSRLLSEHCEAPFEFT